MRKRIFWSIFLASLIVLIIVSCLVVITLYNTYESDAKNDIRTEANYISGKLSEVKNERVYFNGFYSVNRVTLITSDGMVIYDNTVNPNTMENHTDRPEVLSALATGTGESFRYSNTLSDKTLYYAVKTPEGNVLRISRTHSSALGLLWAMLPILVIIVIAVALLSIFLSRILTRHIIKPIHILNLDAPSENDTYDELSPLLLQLERQNEELKGKMLEITQQQREFEAVTESMSEGLILLSPKGNILLINRSAINIFGAENCTGKHILTLNRSINLHEVADGALKGTHSEAELEIRNRYYQLFGSPLESKNGVLGAVILILDITDKQIAERSRREFTANVSHELKTPLTSIAGYAEIMKNGTAKPEDMQGFAARIHQEAGSLITLVEDILRLSQLDEKVKLPDKENIDLLVLVEKAFERLQTLAERQGISLSVKGEHIVISGYRKILEEMINNLCDNAIKYNSTHGSVTVSVSYYGESPIVTVEDTGIGISEEHQPHVFERFYRVDKSRSKATGGTGLGLSIVKHGAIIHNAEITLDSSVGNGTKIAIIFPKDTIRKEEK
ncbi:MAG: PAS domain S-box protein [Thermoclostridium sp.]|nr:PAS domain S-box protein [Thermoclostridium sp.]